MVPPRKSLLGLLQEAATASGPTPGLNHFPGPGGPSHAVVTAQRPARGDLLRCSQKRNKNAMHGGDSVSLRQLTLPAPASSISFRRVSRRTGN
ncbi:hypothetical protein FOMPIDRAFT_1025919 [Fomitopsis schrenkii]|uniref:Uncharacterized protein n=1 Tax=Fomitopsis schrenkii TaxID=2126942 RepID=S8F045_FOMSC|nr:hypothetical protein FOMPIDRAFT_1025919 [Fomitopsis schrenkii]